MESETLLQWKVTTKGKNLSPKGSRKFLTVMIIAGTFIASIYLLLAGIPFEMTVILIAGYFLFFAAIVIYFYSQREKQVTFEYTITTHGVERKPKFESKFFDKIQQFLIEWKNIKSDITGMGNIYFRQFNTVSHYEVEGEKITLHSKKLLEQITPVSREFVIIPNNNIKEITAILDKFIKKK